MTEIDPVATSCAYAFEMWANAPMPMATLFRTLDVSKIRKISYKKVEILHAYVPVYRPGGFADQRIL